MNFGQTFKNGFTYEINVFQNYSDNDYHIEAPVEDFETGRIDRDKRCASNVSMIRTIMKRSLAKWGWSTRNGRTV